VEPRHPYGALRRQLLEEADLTDVHPQHGRREHGGLVERRHLHDHRRGHAVALEVHAVEGAADADADADLLGPDAGDGEAGGLRQPVSGDVVDGSGDLGHGRSMPAL